MWIQKAEIREDGITYNKLGLVAKDEVEPGVADKNYVHVQTVPSAVWEVPHGLGKIPAVTVEDSTGRVVYGKIDRVNNDVITITFKHAFAGKASCN